VNGEHEENVTDTDLDLTAGADLSAEDLVADSLATALKALREEADRVAAMPIDDESISAAEALTEQAAQLDEELSKAARRDEDRG
jgi:hypothetical protein